MKKFTQGKWEYDGGKLIKTADGKIIADILPALDCVGNIWEIADIGNLIAAAPEMYEMLETIANKTQNSGVLVLTSDKSNELTLDKEKTVYYEGKHFVDIVGIRELLERIDGEEIKNNG